MNILSNSEHPDKWKNKYFDLLDENEKTEKNNQRKEQLLCKTIIRLSLATTGFNKALDPYLLRIRNQLKKGLNSENLNRELEKFSSALMTLDEVVPEATLPDATLLFEFLFEYFPEKKKELQHLEVKFEKNEFPNQQYLFVAINDLIDSIQQIEPIPEIPDTQTDVFDFKIVHAQLLNLIEGAEIPTHFETRAQQLKDQIHNNESLSTVFDETVSLLFEIKKHIQSEQMEMAEFLANLTEQLTELGTKAAGAYTSSKKTEQKRNLLDQSVSSQMIDFKNNSKKATDLEPLKQLIFNHLEELTKQIQDQQKLEQTERQRIHKEFEFLSNKMTIMERESRQLQKKLDTAHYNALHDPLTDLPNRLAYAERLTTELARFKRYKTPLSLIIWDIDHFKKINDVFGHKAGDKTLVLIAKLLSQHCRETDFVSRFGGEEFTMLLSDTDAKSALKTADKLRQVIENTAFNSSGKKLSITISCGITQFKDDDTGESAFNRADQALYLAKKHGRNQCVVG